MALLIINIKELLQVRESGIEKVSGAEMSVLPQIQNAWLLLKDGIIAGFGPMDSCPDADAEVLDARGRVVLPTWCDSHTHIVYAGNRVGEFVDRINGLTYEEIAKRGGGILNSAQKLNDCPEDVLYKESATRLDEVIRLGTGAIEIKSGYGLTLEGEIKMLKVIKRLREEYRIAIKATFLGAHAFPKDYSGRENEYVDSVVNEMLPRIASEGLADYIDAFCEKGYFSVAQTQEIMAAGNRLGLRPKIHVNQFNSIGGVECAVRNGALSVDHLEVMTPEDIQALKNSVTMPVALPSCSYFLSIPYTPAREMISAGLPLALASDFNPGSTPSGNMNFVVSTACIKMRMTPEEAINAATINGAYAMGISKTHGSITIGKSANLIISKPISAYAELPYAFGSNLVEKVIINGEIIA